MNILQYLCIRFCFVLGLIWKVNKPHPGEREKQHQFWRVLSTPSFPFSLVTPQKPFLFTVTLPRLRESLDLLSPLENPLTSYLYPTSSSGESPLVQESFQDDSLAWGRGPTRWRQFIHWQREAWVLSRGAKAWNRTASTPHPRRDRRTTCTQKKHARHTLRLSTT